MQRELEPEVMDTPEEASEYDAMDHTEANTAFVDRLIALGGRGRMLDIGTGPGHIPLLVCERVPDCHVVAVDLAEHMLAYARRHVAASPHASRIELVKADAKGLAFPDGSFDTVFSNTILHHIPEPEAFVAEAARVVAPGGLLLIRDLYRPPTPARAQELVRTHAAGATPSQAELFRASLHAALTPDELAALVRRLPLPSASISIDGDRHMSLSWRSPAS